MNKFKQFYKFCKCYKTQLVGEHLLKQITCPVLFIQGQKDEFGTLLQVDKTIEAVNGPKEKFILPNIGHSPHRDAPEIVCKKASEFITQFILS